MATEDKNIDQLTVPSVKVDPLKVPVLYTDNVFVTSDENGVVLDFGQRMGATKQVQIVSRVGMSREHAKKLVDVLSKNMLVNKASTQKGPKIIN